MRTKIGVITSAKMDKTVAVTVHRAVMHPTYAKRYRVSKKFLADTNGLMLGLGDEVVISECRPLSKRKCFKVTEILKKAIQTAEMKTEQIEMQVKRDHRDANYEKNQKNEKNQRNQKSSSDSSTSSVSSLPSVASAKEGASSPQ